jgi:hypothetical protein
LDHALNQNDRGDIRLPFRANDRWRRVKHGNGSGFMAIAPFLIDGLNAGKRHGDCASGLDHLMQRWLVALELNDQMRVCGGGGFEGFF